jgi:hypothetical protein
MRNYLWITTDNVVTGLPSWCRGHEKKDDKIGDYRADLTPDMTGDWSVDLSYQGPQGPAKLAVPVKVKQ